MIAYSYISKSLKLLDRNFRRSRSQSEEIYLSKIAILELCGWIEISMDEIVIGGCNRSVREPENQKFLRESVKRNHGFAYDENFKPTLISLIGAIGYEAVTARIPLSVRLNFRIELRNLANVRKNLAHTYLKGATLNLDAPSVTFSRYQIIADGLKSYDSALRQYC